MEKENKKILLVTPSLSGGGAEKMLLFVADVLVEKYKEVTVATFLADKDLSDEKFHSIFIKSNSTSRIAKIKAIRKVVINGQYDCLITFGVSFALWCKLATLFLPIKLIASERRAPMNLKIHWKLLSKIIYRMFDGIVYQLETVRIFFGNLNNQAVIIPNPFMSPKKQQRVQSLTDRDYVVTSAAARLNESEKGMDILINSFLLISEKYPELELHLYGDDQEMKLTQLVPENFREKIKIFPKSNDIVSIINQSCLFVLPSRVEGIPNMLLEVMGAGNPVIAADCPPGGPRLLTRDGQDGLLFKNGDVEDLALKMDLLLTNEELSRQLIIKSKNVVKRFDMKKIGQEWQAFVGTVLD